MSKSVVEFTDELKKRYVDGLGCALNGAQLETRLRIIEDFCREVQVPDRYEIALMDSPVAYSRGGVRLMALSQNFGRASGADQTGLLAARELNEWLLRTDTEPEFFLHSVRPVAMLGPEARETIFGFTVRYVMPVLKKTR